LKEVHTYQSATIFDKSIAAASLQENTSIKIVIESYLNILYDTSVNVHKCTDHHLCKLTYFYGPEHGIQT